jgi:hypothetical protein
MYLGAQVRGVPNLEETSQLQGLLGLYQILVLEAETRVLMKGLEGEVYYPMLVMQVGLLL